jgi:hypothetical protein
LHRTACGSDCCISRREKVGNRALLGGGRDRNT